MLKNLFIEILITSCVGTALAGILAVIRPITKKHFSSRWHYYMWLAVLAVMMCPIRLSIPDKPAASEPARPVVRADNGLRTAEEISTAVEPMAAGDKPAYEEARQARTEPKAAVIIGVILNNTGVIPALWLAVAAALFAVRLVSYGAFLLKMKRGSRITECEEIKKYTRRKITVRISDNISSPSVIGLVKPVLLLPSAKLTDRQLDDVLRHEITHLRRHDVLYKWFAAFVKCAHWFNPAIYFISRRIDIDCEISCDMAATAGMSGEEKIGYMDTVLALMTNAGGSPLATGMTGSKKILKKRFLAIVNRTNGTKSARIFSGIAALAAAAAAFGASIGVLSGCDIPDGKGASTAEPMNTAEDSRLQRYARSKGVSDGERAVRTSDFYIALPDGAEIDEDVMNYSLTPNMEKQWSVKMIPDGDISVSIQNEAIDVPDSEESLKRRYTERETWQDGEESPYRTGEYFIDSFSKQAYPDPLNPDYSVIGYRYMVNFADWGAVYIQEIPMSNGKTLRAAANIKTGDENTKKAFMRIVQSIKTKEIAEISY